MKNNGILKQVVDFMAESESFIIPIKQIHEHLTENNKNDNFSVDTLTQMMEQDERFQVYEGPEVESRKAMEPLIPEHEMEALGFYRGPRAMLNGRVPSRKDVVSFLLKKADQTFETLKRAWDVRPEENEVIEDQLLKALAKAQRLQRELQTVLTQEKKSSVVPENTEEN